MLSDYPDIMTVEEVTDALRVGFNALYELLNTGKLKGFRNGRVWLVPKAAVVEFIRTQSNLLG